jgi:hypothetical protein
VARAIDLLTAAHVQHAKPGMHKDGGGLYLQVTAAKQGGLNKSWVFRYRRGGRKREIGLGSIATIGLAEARERARRAREMLLDGRDPIEVRAAARTAGTAEKAAAPTFESCAVKFMAAHEAGWRNAKHRYQWTATLRTFAYPVIGKMPVDLVATPHILQILTPIWNSKNETASRLRGRIEAILDWAGSQGYRKKGENPARWKENLKYSLPPRSRVRKGEKQPALPWSSIPELMAELRAQVGIAPRALEFTILTAARSGETRGATWAEIAGDVWTVSGERMKGGQEHRVR